MNVVIPLHMNVELTLSGHCSFFRRASTVGHIRCRLVSEHVIVSALSALTIFLMWESRGFALATSVVRM